MTLVVGEPGAVEPLVEGLRADGVEATPVVLGPAAAGDSPVAALARALVELEALFDSESPERVLLADASDASLAAALVAAKVPIPVTAAAEAIAPGAENGRLIAQLTG